ncbi:hypothetical protein [Sphingomonas solaris]|uniref:Lipoprotein n=1 Tax=Alterirhizorhabdus solaris TaxID=2529389 RepID=A0A558QSX3_9SPHN|nr:hypothetical protein [Sphingomonas solaris]TVV70229.1 hypothetical protein FOY91_19595 [Sphingomonas solaris]
MRRTTIILLCGAVLLGGCQRRPAKPEPAPDIVAIAVSTDNTAGYRALAQRCGAASATLQRAGEAMLLVVGRDSTVAARDCFFAAAQAEHRRAHPIAAFIEGLFR